MHNNIKPFAAFLLGLLLVSLSFGALAHGVDDNTRVLQALRLEVDEAYPHCPRAFAFSNLWDEAGIKRNREVSSDRHWYQKWSAQADT